MSGHPYPKTKRIKHGHAPTAAEKRHMDAVASLGCIVCYNLGFGFSPAIIHHAYAGRKGGRDHSLVLPLCAAHHNTPLTAGIAIHASKPIWESLYGTEAELLRQVQALLEKAS